MKTTLCVLIVCVAWLVVPVLAQEKPAEDKVAKLEQDVAALRTLLGKVVTAMNEITKRQAAQAQTQAAADPKKSRGDVEKACADLGLKLKGVTVQQQTRTVQCVP